ncbi:MAG: 1-acyl-sn-glycerol-3-phosphate acyltransferase [Bacteroidota bacterium]|nr:1-acyl-sn-glycerol-3-phosphate acyltransferase [Bacteroidota bacterium]MDP3433868.1 1-acyl-sn-glycerol-3-phosphate acyltransferase [Bacteroidota bacterium]
MNVENQEPVQLINIREVFLKKNPGLAKKLPGFVYRYINRIMHIDEINEILINHGNERGIEFANSMVKHFNVHQTINGIENIPTSGRYIFASNHPLGGFDSFLIMNTVYNILGEVNTLVNDVLMNIPQLRPVFVPLNKHGGLPKKVLKQLHEAYSSDKQILIFPSGFASRMIKGQIQDFEWKKHFIAKSIEFQRDIIPVHVSGRNSDFFYRLANFRSFFKLKWNLEMFYLADETFRHKNQKFTITFGKSISYKHFDKSKTLDQWAAEVRDIVYKLPIDVGS